MGSLKECRADLGADTCATGRYVLRVEPWRGGYDSMSEPARSLTIRVN